MFLVPLVAPMLATIGPKIIGTYPEYQVAKKAVTCVTRPRGIALAHFERPKTGAS